MINLGRLGNFRHVFPLYNKVLSVGLDRFFGHNITLGPASRRISATCTLIAVRNAVETWNFNIQTSLANNDHGCEGDTLRTCIETSKTVSGAGLTSVMSWAAADVMSDPADRMAGCMRAASVSGLKIESGDG